MHLISFHRFGWSCSPGLEPLGFIFRIQFQTILSFVFSLLVFLWPTQAPYCGNKNLQKDKSGRIGSCRRRHENPLRRSILTQSDIFTKLLFNSTSNWAIEDMKTHQVQDWLWHNNAISFSFDSRKRRGREVQNFSLNRAPKKINTDAAIQYFYTSENCCVRMLNCYYFHLIL